jgi:hypothetical protein
VGGGGQSNKSLSNNNLKQVSVLRDPFKIGITGDPYHRWQVADYAYKREGFQTMTVIGVATSTKAIADMERQVISAFRRFGRDGVLVNPDGNALCLNRAPGGENAQVGGHGMAFLYVASRV